MTYLDFIPAHGFANNKLSVEFVSGSKVRVSGKCQFTNEDHSIEVPLAGFLKWREDHILIQEAMPDITAEDREFLISGISPKGWIQNVEPKF